MKKHWIETIERENSCPERYQESETIYCPQCDSEEIKPIANEKIGEDWEEIYSVTCKCMSCGFAFDVYDEYK